MALLDDVFDAFRDAFQALNPNTYGAGEPLEVIMLAPNSPRPSTLPYITVGLGSIGNVGMDERVDKEAGTYMTGARIMAVSVEGYGAAALDILEDFAISLDRPDVLEIFTDAGLSVYTAGNLTNLTGLVANALEPRWLREFDAAYVLESSTITIDSVALVGFSEEGVPGFTLNSTPNDENPLLQSFVIEVEE